MKHHKLLTLTLLLVTLFLGGVTGLAQEAGEAAAKPGGESIIKVILHGGPLIIMIWIAILGTSITMITFVAQNIISLRKERLAPTPLVNSLQELINAGNYQDAVELCNTKDNYLANVLGAGLSRMARGKEAVEDVIAEYALREAQVLRTRNSYLSVIGVVSPMIGLLGTVIGMMGAFATLGASGISDPRGLATSIGEVLMATASGLFIAIPAFIAYYIFRNRAQMVIVHADDKVNQLIADIPYEHLPGVATTTRTVTKPVMPPSTGTTNPLMAPPPPAMAPAATTDSDPRRLSSSMMTKCPVCNGVIAVGQSPCTHCGAKLDWAH